MVRIHPRWQSAVLWGAIGALSFLVAHGAYLLVGGTFLGLGPIVGVTGAVFVAATAGSYYAERRFGLFIRRFSDTR